MNKLNNTKFINPDWLTGFTDAEGCFTVVITQRSNLNWRVIVEINLHTKDISILELIKDFFGVGYVTTRIDKSKSVYRVTKVEDLKPSAPYCACASARGGGWIRDRKFYLKR